MDKPIARNPFITATAGISPGESHLLFFSSMSGSPPLVAGNFVPMQKT